MSKIILKGPCIRSQMVKLHETELTNEGEWRPKLGWEVRVLWGRECKQLANPLLEVFVPSMPIKQIVPLNIIGTFVETNNIRLLISYMQRIWMWYGCIIGPRIELQHRRDDFKSLDEAFWIDTWICLYDIKIKWIKIFKIEPRHRCYEMNLYPNN